MSFRTSVDRQDRSRLQATKGFLIVASVLTAISMLAASGNSDTGLQRNAAATPDLADVRWLGTRLSRLSARQVRDAFRGAGFGADDAEALTTTFSRRIAALKAL